MLRGVSLLVRHSHLCPLVGMAAPSVVRKGEKEKVDAWERATFPSTEKLLRHPLVPLALVLDGVVLFTTGAMSGAAAKTLICIRRKIERMIRSATSDHSSNGGTSDQLSKLREDLNYVKKMQVIMEP